MMTAPRLARWALTGPLILAAAALAGCSKIGAETQRKAAATKGKKPPVITTAKPEEIEVQDHLEFTGRTEAVQSVNVRARVTGYLIAGGTHVGGSDAPNVLFHDGDEVEEGQLLFEIDPRLYKAEVDRTKATLKQAESKLRRQEQNFRRVATLFGNNARSRDEYDQAEDDFLEAQAAIGVAAANVESAELNLGFTKVTAPVSGRLSRRMVDVGNLVKADDTPLIQIADVHRLYVVYDVDERSVLKIREMIRAGTFTPMREGKLIVDVALADDPDFSRPIPGVVNFSETTLDANSGTLRLRADVENPRIRTNGVRGLSPGQFVKVRLPLGAAYRSLSIPEESLMSDQGKKYIYLFRPADAKAQAEYRAKDAEAARAKAQAGGPAPPPRAFRVGSVAILREKEPSGQGQLVLGPLRDGRRVVREGIQLTDEVIVTGLQGVRPGGEARVETRPSEHEQPAGAPPSKADGPQKTPIAGDSANPPATTKPAP